MIYSILSSPCNLRNIYYLVTFKYKTNEYVRNKIKSLVSRQESLATLHRIIAIMQGRNKRMTARQKLVRQHQWVDEHDNAGTAESHRQLIILKEVVCFLLPLSLSDDWSSQGANDDDDDYDERSDES